MAAYAVTVVGDHERHVVVPAVGHLLDPSVTGVEPHLADVDRADAAGVGAAGASMARISGSVVFVVSVWLMSWPAMTYLPAPKAMSVWKNSRLWPAGCAGARGK